MYAIITDITPTYGTVLELLDLEELRNRFDDIGPRDRVAHADELQPGERPRLGYIRFVDDLSLEIA